MARRRARVKATASKLRQAKRIVSAMTSRGAQRSSVVHAAIHRAGISTRTYRTARKQLGTKALRASRKGGARGSGRWLAKAP